MYFVCPNRDDGLPKHGLRTLLGVKTTMQIALVDMSESGVGCLMPEKHQRHRHHKNNTRAICSRGRKVVILHGIESH